MRHLPVETLKSARSQRQKGSAQARLNPSRPSVVDSPILDRSERAEYKIGRVGPEEWLAAQILLTVEMP